MKKKVDEDNESMALVNPNGLIDDLDLKIENLIFRSQ